MKNPGTFWWKHGASTTRNTNHGSQELIFWAVAFPTEAWLQWLTDGSRVPGGPGVPRSCSKAVHLGSRLGMPGGKKTNRLNQLSFINYIIWLVISNIFYFPFHVWDNPSHLIFFIRRVETTNQSYPHYVWLVKSQNWKITKQRPETKKNN